MSLRSIDRSRMTPKELRIQVPHYFRCPISLDLMRDPVTLSTGQTYDRASIEKWVAEGNATCPATMQILQNPTLIPNHTLRRLIQDWCVANRSKGVERIPTPKQPADPQRLNVLLEEISGSNRCGRLFALKTLRTLAKESEDNRTVIAECGAMPVLISALFADEPIPNCHWDLESKSFGEYCGRADSQTGDEDAVGSDCESAEEALGALVLLPLTDVERSLLTQPQRLSALASLLCRGSMEARMNVGAMLELLCSSDEMKSVVGATKGVLEGLVKLLRLELYPRAVKTGIKSLLSICLAKPNRELAVRAGAASALVELLPDANKGDAERALATLELLCTSEEGRAAVAGHALAVPALVKMILKVSDRATEYAAGTLWAIGSQSESVQLAAIQAGVFTQLLLLIQSDCTSRAKRKAMDLLKLLRPIWSENACAPDFGWTDVAPF